MPKMKLSDAILKGCEGTEQCFWRYFSGDGKKCCALGAALIGLGYIGKRGIINPVSKLTIEYPFLANGPVFWGDITYENDSLRLTREQIAAKLKESGL